MNDLETRVLAAIDEADHDTIVALLAPLSEPERAALDPAVALRAGKCFRIHYTLPFVTPKAECLLAGDRSDAAHLAWLGTGNPDTWPSLEEADESRDGWPRRMTLQHACARPAGHRVLADRRPAWLPRLADDYLRYGNWLWDPAWLLVVDGLIPRPASTEYLHGLARYAGTSPDRKLAEMVRRDPALLAVDLSALLALPDGIAVLVRGDIRAERHESEFRRTRVWSPLPAEVLVGPLVARVDKILAAEDSPRWGDSVAGDFCHLVAGWIRPERTVAERGPLGTPRDWLIGRLPRSLSCGSTAGTAGCWLCPPMTRAGSTRSCSPNGRSRSATPRSTGHSTPRSR